MVKKYYLMPLATVEEFTPNSYISACPRWKIVASGGDSAGNAWFVKDFDNDNIYSSSEEGDVKYHANPQGLDVLNNQTITQEQYRQILDQKCFWWNKNVHQSDLKGSNSNQGYMYYPAGNPTHGQGAFVVANIGQQLVPIENPNRS